MRSETNLLEMHKNLCKNLNIMIQEENGSLYGFNNNIIASYQDYFIDGNSSEISSFEKDIKILLSKNNRKKKDSGYVMQIHIPKSSYLDEMAKIIYDKSNMDADCHLSNMVHYMLKQDMPINKISNDKVAIKFPIADLDGVEKLVYNQLK